MNNIKVWTLTDQNTWCNSYLKVPIGTHVKPHAKSYTGDKDRLGVLAVITGIEVRKLESGHVAYETMGYTHEETYIVKYVDGYESTLWPEEIEVFQ